MDVLALRIGMSVDLFREWFASGSRLDGRGGPCQRRGGVGARRRWRVRRVVHVGDLCPLGGVEGVTSSPCGHRFDIAVGVAPLARGASLIFDVDRWHDW